MELRELDAFVRVVNLGGFRKAAESLYITQPAVSRQIAVLERELSTKLLERMGKRVLLTASGEVLYNYATQILHLRQEALRRVEDVREGTSGRLTIGASSTAATYVLPALLRRFRVENPHVELRVHTGVSSRIGEQVLRNEVDAGVVMDFPGHPDITEVGLAEYAMCLVVYPDHRFANPLHLSGISQASLEGEPLIVMEPGTNLRAFVERVLSSTGIVGHISLELDNVEAIKKMIEARLGISLLPFVAVREEALTKRLVALPLSDLPNAVRAISVVYRKDKYVFGSLRHFVDLLQSELHTSMVQGRDEPRVD